MWEEAFLKKGLPPHPLSKMFREEDRRIYSTNNFSLRRQAKYHTAGISLFPDTQLKQSKKQTGQNLSAFLYGAVWDEIEVIYAPATPPCLLFCFLPFCPLISVSVLRIFMRQAHGRSERLKPGGAAWSELLFLKGMHCFHGRHPVDLPRFLGITFPRRYTLRWQNPPWGIWARCRHCRACGRRGSAPVPSHNTAWSGPDPAFSGG